MGFQAPKGTRDLFPPEMATLRRIESAWRNASVNAGFDEIEGPTFEHLDLYTVKSGEGIVSELLADRVLIIYLSPRSITVIPKHGKIVIALHDKIVGIGEADWYKSVKGSIESKTGDKGSKFVLESESVDELLF